MSTFAMAEPSYSHLMLSSRLVSELAQAPSTLRTTTERIGLAVPAVNWTRRMTPPGAAS
jgi:hypothetical protein